MYSTPQVARLVGIGRQTVMRWLKEGLRPPRLQRVGGVAVRLWGEKDVKRLREYKTARYRKGRGRKPKPKR